VNHAVTREEKVEAWHYRHHSRIYYLLLNYTFQKGNLS